MKTLLQVLIKVFSNDTILQSFYLTVPTNNLNFIPRLYQFTLRDPPLKYNSLLKTICLFEGLQNHSRENRWWICYNHKQRMDDCWNCFQTFDNHRCSNKWSLFYDHDTIGWHFIVSDSVCNFVPTHITVFITYINKSYILLHWQ